MKSVELLLWLNSELITKLYSMKHNTAVFVCYSLAALFLFLQCEEVGQGSVVHLSLDYELD